MNNKDFCAGLPVAILFGGRGTERFVSEKSAANLIRSMERCKIAHYRVGILPSGEWCIFYGSADEIDSGAWREACDECKRAPCRVTKDQNGRCALQSTGADDRTLYISGVFPVLHGEGGEDGVIQGLLEASGIPFVGCDTSSSVVAFDKSFCKIIAQSVGIPVVPFVTFAVGDENIHNGSFSFTIDDARAAAEEKFGYPMFVKPCRQGSSFGADVINDRSEFFAKVKSAAEYGGRAIIEKYMKGVRELECAYAEYNGATVLTSPGYVEYGGRFYDYHSKYEDSVGTRLRPAANVDADISQMIRSYSRLLAGVLGVRGISRIDFFLADGEVYFNEINTIPGLTSASLYPMMLDECGVGFDKVIMGLVNSLCREAGL